MSAKRIFGFLALMLWCLNITALGDVVPGVESGGAGRYPHAKYPADGSVKTPRDPARCCLRCSERNSSYPHAIQGVTGKVPASASVESTAVAAGRAVLVNFYPMLQPSLDELQIKPLGRHSRWAAEGARFSLGRNCCRSDPPVAKLRWVESNCQLHSR